MGAAIALRDDYDGSGLRRLATLHDSAISEGVISLRPYLFPDISGSIGVVKYPLSELIETETKP